VEKGKRGYGGCFKKGFVGKKNYKVKKWWRGVKGKREKGGGRFAKSPHNKPSKYTVLCVRGALAIKLVKRKKK